ncbi:dipeptidase [Parahaliea mediterranea]|uniref:dipeptidase n=1 Tax=Parahaliea mediterranea TaxID=651086 RepID=UPI000E2EE5C5|nr:membrane dipeptidase [Parahaliea mediterranea]
MNGLTRRHLLRYSVAGAAFVGGVGGMGALSPAFAASGGYAFGNTLVINNLGGIGNPNLRLKPAAAPAGPVGSSYEHLDERALKDLNASGTSAINVTMGHVSGPVEPFEYTVAEIAAWNRIIEQHPDRLLKVLATGDILEARRSGRSGVIFGFQNTTMLGSDASRVGIFAGLGVRIIQLTYNDRNAVGAGSMVAENSGLTDFGREVVAALNAERVLVDLSHSGEQTCLDAIAASAGPVCISHTGCRALSDLPRNKTDAELRALAERGGVAGIYFMPFLKADSFPDASDVVRHIEHAIKVCGEDHVGIGTDGGTTAVDDLPAYHAAIDAEIAARRAAGISARGEKPGVVPFIPDLQGPGQFRQLADMMAAAGHPARIIEKVLGQNFLRLQREVWGA